MSKKPTRTPVQREGEKPNSKMDYKVFVERAIKNLREDPYKGIHVVYSSFNAAFRQYYNEDPRPIVDRMVADGFLVSRPVRGGAIIMLATDVDEDSKKAEGGTSAALAKILTQND